MKLFYIKLSNNAEFHILESDSKAAMCKAIEHFIDDKKNPKPGEYHWFVPGSKYHSMPGNTGQIAYLESLKQNLCVAEMRIEKTTFIGLNND